MGGVGGWGFGGLGVLGFWGLLTTYAGVRRPRPADSGRLRAARPALAAFDEVWRLVALRDSHDLQRIDVAREPAALNDRPGPNHEVVALQANGIHLNLIARAHPTGGDQDGHLAVEVHRGQRRWRHLQRPGAAPLCFSRCPSSLDSPYGIPAW